MTKRSSKRRTTTIIVHGERWDVPRGFGQAYLRMSKHEDDLLGRQKPGEVIGALTDMLGLVGYTAAIDTIASWTKRERLEAWIYASTLHLIAGDNAIQPHPKPSWFPAEPWAGLGPRGNDPLDGPPPTEITHRASATTREA